MNIILIEWYLLLLCLIAILVLTVLKKRKSVIILAVIAVLQHFLLNWNVVLSHWIGLFR